MIRLCEGVAGDDLRRRSQALTVHIRLPRVKSGRVPRAKMRSADPAARGASDPRCERATSNCCASAATPTIYRGGASVQVQFAQRDPPRIIRGAALACRRTMIDSWCRPNDTRKCGLATRRPGGQRVHRPVHFAAARLRSRFTTSMECSDDRDAATMGDTRCSKLRNVRGGDEVRQDVWFPGWIYIPGSGDRVHALGVLIRASTRFNSWADPFGHVPEGPAQDRRARREHGGHS